MNRLAFFDTADFTRAEYTVRAIDGGWFVERAVFRTGDEYQDNIWSGPLTSDERPGFYEIFPALDAAAALLCEQGVGVFRVHLGRWVIDRVLPTSA